MTAYEIARAKIKTANITETDILLAVEEVEQAIKTYCNLEELPIELMYTWANMAVELAKYEYYIYASPTSETIDLNDVSSIDIGDTKVSLQGGNKSSEKGRAVGSHRPSLDDIVLDYKAQLNRFRRMVW